MEGGIAEMNYPEQLSTTPVRESELLVVLGKLERAITKTGKISDILTSRLQPILGAGGPLKDSEKAINPEFSSPLAQEINTKVRLLETINESTEAMMRRIEI